MLRGALRPFPACSKQSRCIAGHPGNHRTIFWPVSLSCCHDYFLLQESKIDLTVNLPFAAPAACSAVWMSLFACELVKLYRSLISDQLRLTCAAGPASKRTRCSSRLTVEASTEQKSAAHKAPLQYLREAAKVGKASSALVVHTNTTGGTSSDAPQVDVDLSDGTEKCCILQTASEAAAAIANFFS